VLSLWITWLNVLKSYAGGVYVTVYMQVNFCTMLLVLCRNKSLVDAAVEHVLKQRRTDAVPITGGLTFVDIFYREVVNTAE